MAGRADSHDGQHYRPDIISTQSDGVRAGVLFTLAEVEMLHEALGDVQASEQGRQLYAMLGALLHWLNEQEER